MDVHPGSNPHGHKFGLLFLKKYVETSSTTFLLKNTTYLLLESVKFRTNLGKTSKNGTKVSVLSFYIWCIVANIK